MKYTEEHMNKMTWEEFGQICDKLICDIESYGVKFDAITPILRTGMVPAAAIAHRLRILNIIPVQIKYDYSTLRLKQLLPIIKPLDPDFAQRPKILVVECNTFTGFSAGKVHELILKEFPEAELYYATVTRVFRKPINELKMYKKYFYGVMTDEEFIATDAEKSEFNLRERITVNPWETIEYELEDLNAANS